MLTSDIFYFVGWNIIQYTQLPKLLSDRLFIAFAGKKTNIIGEKAFVKGFKVLTLGTIEEKFTLIFKMLDYKNNGAITREDCQFLLQYIPRVG